MRTRPLHIAVVAHQEVIAHGLSAMLAQHPGRVREVASSPTAAGLRDIDVVLYDVLGVHTTNGADLDQLVEEGGTTVVVVSRDLRPDLRGRALAMGADSWVSMSATSLELVVAVENAAAGVPVAPALDTLGASAGLSEREVDILALIAQGYGNHEIAARLHLSINTVKTYIRTAYSKIGARSRTQAVVWCLQHGFAPAGS